MTENLERRQFVKAGALATAAAAAALAGCRQGQGGGQSAGQSGGTLSYGIQNPTGVEPYTLEDENAMAVCYQLFDPLTRYDPTTKELVPCMALTWECNDAADEWTFHLRDDATFHDGSKVTAKSFVYGWTRLVDPSTTDTPSAVAYHLSMVDGYGDLVSGEAVEFTGLSAPDDTTFKVRLSAPYADFPFVCSACTLAPIPEGRGRGDDYHAYAMAPVGNGPFKMKGEWKDGQFVELESYEGYWGDKPKVAGMLFTVYRDTLTAYKEVEAGSCDCANVPLNQASQSKERYGEAEDGGYVANPGHQYFSGEMLYTQYLVFNVEDPLVKDVRVRQALSLAINREAICTTVYQGAGTPATDIVPPAIAGSTPGTWQCSFDREKAGQLLDEAGYPAGADGRRGLAVKLMTNAANDKTEYEAMISDWDAVGIDASIDQVEYAAMLDKYYSGDFSVAARGWYADYPIADNYLYPLFYSGSSDNMSHFKDERFDEMIMAARAVEDEEKRVAAMHECDAYAASLMPVAPLNWRGLAKCATARCHDFRITPQILPQASTMWLEV